MFKCNYLCVCVCVIGLKNITELIDLKIQTNVQNKDS